MVINVWWNAVRHFYRPSLLILVRHLFWPIQREKHGWNMWNAARHFSICPFLGPTWVKHGWNLWNAVRHFSIGPFLGPTWVKHGWNLCEMLWSIPTYQFSAKSKKPKREEKKPNCRDSAFTCPKLWCNPCSKCYGVDCVRTYFTRVQKLWCNLCSKCSQWTASVHTSHMSKAVM